MRDVCSIKLTQILVTDRLRAVDPERALFLAASMKVDGLNSPIEVRPAPKKPGMYILVVGGHRHAAAVVLEWTEIDAIVLDLNPDQARMREIDENLYRAELTELDRAVFLHEKKCLYEKLHPETRHGAAPPEGKVAILGDFAPRFSKEACERLGVSERTLQRTIARAALEPEVRARISGTKIATKGSHLDALLRLPPEQRMPVLDLILGEVEDAPRSIGEAAQRISGVRAAAVPEEEAQLETLMKAWRTSPNRRARDLFLSFLAGQGEVLPKVAGAK